jgi:hypothetical protein
MEKYVLGQQQRGHARAVHDCWSNLGRRRAIYQDIRMIGARARGYYNYNLSTIPVSAP